MVARRVVAAALLFGIAFAPMGALAGPLHPLAAQLDLDAPARVTGSLAVPSGHDLALQLDLPADPTPDPVELILSPQAELVLHRWVRFDAYGPAATVPFPERDQISTRSLTDVRILLHRLDDAAQMGLMADRQRPVASLDVPTASCLVDTSDPQRPFNFPSGEGQPHQAPWGRLDVPGDAVDARCSAPGVRATGLSSVLVYGMAVDVESNEWNGRIETGPSSGADAPAPHPAHARHSPSQISLSRVEHLLEVRRTGAYLSTDVPLPQEFRIQASVLAATGVLDVPQSFGRLDWDIVSQTGRIEAFDAQGAFAFRAASPDRLQIEGRTTSNPQVQAAAAIPSTDRTGTAVAISVAAGIGLLLLLLPLFSRLFDHDVLNNQRRREILDIVTREPGVEVNTVARRLGYRWTNIAYHVRRLELTGHVVARRVGGRTALFLPLAVPREKTLATVLLRRETPRRVHEILSATPGLDQHRLSRELGLDQSQVSRTLKGLLEAGLVTAHRQGRRTMYASASAAPSVGAITSALAPSGSA